jgi:hypothetical protein
MGGRTWWLGAVVAAVTAATARASSAQTDEPLDLTRLTGPIELDGMPDEEAWAAVPPLPLTMYFPTFRGTASERSEIRVAYDDRFLYASGRFYDSDPDGIRVNSLYRDRWNGDDAFAIYVDPFNDNQNAKWFGATPSGMRFDQLVTDDGVTLNASWDGFWDAETFLTDEGWFVEVRIPFSTLGFQTDDAGGAVMGLTVTRLVSRTGERVTFPAIDPRFAFRQPSVAQDVRVEGVDAGNPIYVTPYALSGVGRESVPTANGFEAERDYPNELGLDVRYAVTSNFTLDVTVNTDFAQVEADDQQVNLDRFSLFFPEKRRFFQEGSGLFDFVMGGGNRLFHSRRIGLDEDNHPVPVIGGARLVGRLGEWDVGLLNVQTEAQDPVPTENFGVARVRRRVFNDYSTVGAMVTSRVRTGRDNVATGVDGVFRVVGDHYLTTRMAASFDGMAASLVDRSRLYALWERRVNRGLQYAATYTHSGPDYRPEMGYQPRRDVTRANFFANYYIFSDESSYFRRVWPGALAFSTFRNSDGSLESAQYAVWVQWETKEGGGGWIEPKLFVEDVLTPFTIGGAVDIPAGRHTYADLQLAWSLPLGRKLRTSIDARAGSFFDGGRVQVIAKPTWNVSPHLELGIDYQWTRLRFEERSQATDIHLARVRIRSALDSRASGNAFIQYNSTTDRLDLNLRLRYNFAEGRDLWLVFNEGLVTERLPDPTSARLPLSMSRTLILKYTHTWGG